MRMKKLILTVLATFPLASPLVSAMNEIEPNEPITQPQYVVSPSTEVEIQAVMGTLGGGMHTDLDFYSFYGQAGDVVDVDIDGGIGGQADIDSRMAIFGPGPDYPVLRDNDDSNSLDEGSISLVDPRIEQFVLPTTGIYTVGVSDYQRDFVDGGGVSSSSSSASGDYKLVITGLRPAVKQISIEIRPGSRKRVILNPRSKGVIRVAIHSSLDFNAMLVDQTSLRFGAEGTEKSLHKCKKRGKDVNHDGRVDLICSFHVASSGFSETSLEGILKGQLKESGVAFEGRGILKVIPKRIKKRNKDREWKEYSHREKHRYYKDREDDD